MAASGSPPTPDAAGEWVAPYRPDLGLVLGPFVRGRRDPSWRADPNGSWWWVTRTPDGAASLRLSVARDRVSATAWGEGADWVVAQVPSLLGFDDDLTGFAVDAVPDQLQGAWSRLAERWRVPRSGRVVETLLAAVLEQKVTGVEARRAWRLLVTEMGDPAPGPVPHGMALPPDAQRVRGVPSWTWHRWGVQPPMSATIVRACGAASRLEQCVDLTHDQARSRLMAVPGIGGWTAAEVGSRALGDPDAVSFGDYHLAGHVVYAFTGRRDGTDEQMAQLLEPFVGHRHRVQRLVESSGLTKPARGPRATITDHRRH